MGVKCEECLLLSICLQEVSIWKDSAYTFGHSVNLFRWVNECCKESKDTYHEVKLFFLKRKGYLKENEE